MFSFPAFRFRIYYGDFEDMEYDDFVDFDVLGRYPTEKQVEFNYN